MPGDTPPISRRNPSTDPSLDQTNSNLQPDNQPPTFVRRPTGQGNQNVASGAGSQVVQQPPVFTHGSASIPQNLFAPFWPGPQPQPQQQPQPPRLQQPTGIFNKRSQAEAIGNSPTSSQIMTSDVAGQSVKRSRQMQPQGHQPAPQAQPNAAHSTHRTRREMINLANAIQNRGPMRDDSAPLPGFNQGAGGGRNSNAVIDARRDDFAVLAQQNPHLNAEALAKKMQGRYPGTIRNTAADLSTPLKQSWAFGLPTSVVDNMRRVASNPNNDRFFEDSLTKDSGQRGRMLNTGPLESWQKLERRWDNRPDPRTRPEIMEYLRPLDRTPENAAIFASMALPDHYVGELSEALELWRQYDQGTLNPQSLGPRATPLLHPDVVAAQAEARQHAPVDNYLDDVSLISSDSSSPQGTLPPAGNYGGQNLPGLNANSRGDSLLTQLAHEQQQRRLTDPRGDGSNNLTQTRLHQPDASYISTITSGLPTHPVQMQRLVAGNPEYFQPSIPNYPQQSATNDDASPVHMQLVLAGNPDHLQPSNSNNPQQPATSSAANPGAISNSNRYVQGQGQSGPAQQMNAQRWDPQQTQIMSSQPSGQPYVQQTQQPVQQHFQPPNPGPAPYANTGANLINAFNSLQLQGANQPPVYPQNTLQPVQQQGQGGNYLPANQAGVQMQPPFQQNFQYANPGPAPYANTGANLINAFNSLQLQGANQPPVYPQNTLQPVQQQAHGGNYLPANQAGVNMQPGYPQPQAPNMQNMQLGAPLFGQQLYAQQNAPQNLAGPAADDPQLSMSPVNMNYLAGFGSPLPNSSDLDMYFPGNPPGST